MVRIASLVALLPACIIVNSVAVGAAAPRKAYGSPLAYEHLSLNDTADRYAQVGTICVNASGEAVYSHKDDGLHREIQERAWGYGGDMVSVIGVCSLGRVYGVEIGVFRAKPI